MSLAYRIGLPPSLAAALCAILLFAPTMVHAQGAAEPDEIAPTKVSEDAIDLSPHRGSLVSMAGMVVRIDSIGGASAILLGRRGGPVSIRIPRKLTDPDFPRVAVGDKVVATGVLLAPEADAGPTPRLAVTSPARIAPAPTLIERVDWKRTAIGVAGGFLAVLLLMFAWRRLLMIREKPFRASFDQAGGAMIIMDRNLKISEANKAACRLLHRSMTQLKFKLLPQLVTISEGFDAQQVTSNLRRGERSTVGATVQTGDGFVDLDLTFSRVKAGRREYIVVLLHDISRHTDNVNQFRQFHEALLDGMPVEVGVLSPSGKYLYSNGFGYNVDGTRDWLIGKTDIELCRRLGLGPDVALRRRAHRRRAISTGEAVQFEEVIEADGVTRHLLRIYHPVLEQAGGEVGAIASYGMNITELKDSLKALDEARQEADKVGRLKESFLENINEEFRAPISGIIGFAEILEGEVPETQREFVNLIERNGRRLMNTLNAVLDLAGLNNNEFDLAPQIVNIVDEVGAVVEGCREMVEEKGLFMRMEASRPELLARADQVCLARVVQNLIDNAVRFTESGGIVVEVDADDRFANVRVLDSGTGFDPQRTREMFDDFHTSATDSPFVEGVGIGLGITKRLVELMHGRIAFESQLDEGSVFSVSIPRAFPVRGRFGAGQPRLLVADASSDARTMIEYVLESRMFIRSVPDVEAIELEVRRMLFDVILVDVSATKPEQLSEILESIRDRYRDSPAPIVAVDNKDVAHRAEEMLELGFDSYMAKPFKKQTLITDISTLLFKSLFETVATDGVDADDHIVLRPTG